MKGNMLPGNCPGCGRSISAGERTSFCPDCNASGVKDQGIRRVTFECEVSRRRAIEAVRQWWLDELIERNLKAEGKIDECCLQYVPFWKLTVAAEADVKGYRIEGDDVSDKKIPMEHHFDNYLTWTGIAGDETDVGIEFLRNMSEETVPYDECPGPVETVTLSKIGAEARSRKAMEKYILGVADIPVVTSMPMSLDLREAVLLYYPLWIVRYSYSGHTYSATVDGVTGEILAGGAPGDFQLRLRALVSGLIVSITLVSLHVLMLFIFRQLTFLPNNVCPCLGLMVVSVLFFLDVLTFSYIARQAGFFYYGTVIAGGNEKCGYHPPDTMDSRLNLVPLAGMFVGLIMMAFGIFFFFISGNKMYPGLVTFIGETVYLVSCWYSFDNTLKITGEVRTGISP